jgi:dolichyl-phosphate-mannose-protein mannosyltransferase
VVVLVMGLVVQAALVSVAHAPTERHLVGDEQTYAAEAAQLVAGESPAPTFVNPPLYPWALAVVFRVFGPERLAVELVQSALLLLAGLLLWALLGAAGLGPTARALGLALLLLDPQVAAFAQYLWPEVLHLALALLGLWLLVAARPSGIASAFLAGGAFGLAVLAKSLVVPFLPVLIAAAAVTAGSPASRSRGLRAAAFAGGLLVLLVPVVVTNGLRHGYWGIANSGPFNAWVGINDPANRHDYESVVQAAMAEYLALSPDPARRNRAASLAVGRTILRRGPLAVLSAQVAKQYGRLFDRESFFTDQLPGGRLLPDAPPQPRDSWLRAWAYGAYAIVLLLAGLGLALADWGRRGSARRLALPALFLAYNLALFLLLHVKTRYRFAFLPCLVFFGALAVDRLTMEPGLLATDRGKARLVLGLVLGGALLLLAFGRAWPPA